MVFKSRCDSSSSQLTQPIPSHEYRGNMIEATSSNFLAYHSERLQSALTIRVALADDHAEMRVALRMLLSLSKAMELVCEASNGQEAVDCAKRLQPDVLVMDVRMPILNGFEATKQITDLSVATRVILISTYKGTFIIRQAASVGAKGFIPKDEVAAYLLRAIETVHRGNTFFVE
jgi:two-component system, NarL family, nitrate/nitrite response regulator NarL